MPTLYLHSGLHKTGTTTLQKALFDNRDRLARQGILYPRTGLSEAPANWGHHALAEALRQPQSARSMLRDLREEAEAARPDRLVISSEALGYIPYGTLPGPRPYRLIREIFEGYDVRLLVYLRPQADMVHALYNHNVKAVGETRGILEFMAQIAPRLDYQHYLSVAARGLGQEAVLLRRYQPQHLVGGDILEDAATVIGFDLEGVVRPRTARNPGLTPRGLKAMLAANRRLAAAPERLARERARLLRKHPAPPFQKGDLLSPETRQAIAALFREKNAAIARRFLGETGDLFAPEETPEG